MTTLGDLAELVEELENLGAKFWPVYCRDMLGGAFDVDRILHKEHGHDAHFFEYKKWPWSKNRRYWCRGVVHVHDWEIVGPVQTQWQTLMVESCICGSERTRELHK
jgi:hypothetical protein